MKRMVLAALGGTAALAALVVVQGCGVLGGPPTGVAVSAGPDDSDSTVVISWTVPAEGAADKYLVYFQAGDSGFMLLGDTTATSYAHNPHGMTGLYKVAAVFGAESYEGAEKPTTVPIHSTATTLFEINADSIQCGFGWTRDSGVGGVFAMTDSANYAYVDFYVSDYQAGVGSQLCIASPNKADTLDPGAIGIVPRARWRSNGFSDPQPDPQSPVVAYDTAPYTYHIYTQITTQPCYIGCYTAGDTLKHYALIQVDSADATSGRVWVQSWFQLVPGLRLIRH